MKSKNVKSLLAICTVTLQLSTFSSVSYAGARGGMDGGGADPLTIMAQKFEDTARLEESYRAIETQLSKVDLNQDTKEQIQKELRSLIDNEKMKSLPEIIIMGESSEVDGYDIPKNPGEFLTLGGMTKFKRGENVYLAKRVEKYDDNKFNDILLHETLHHVLPLGLSEDEAFVEKMANSILSGRDMTEINRALKLKGVYNKDYFSGTGFMELARIPEIVLYRTHFFKDGKNSAYMEAMENAVRAGLHSSVKKNIANMSKIDFLNTVMDSARESIRKQDQSKITEEYLRDFVSISIHESLKKINPGVEIKNCNVSDAIFTCAKKNRVLMKDLVK